MSESKFFIKLPPIGAHVQWFPQAEIQRGAQAALVIGVNGELLILETVDTSGLRRIRNQTRHMADPVLSSNTTWRLEHGGWDWIPGDPLRDIYEPKIEVKPVVAGKAPKKPEQETLPDSMHVMGRV